MAQSSVNSLLFSTLFPHEGEPSLGIFVENRLRHLVKDENVSVFVVAPVPWFPFKSDVFGSYGRSARAGNQEERNGIKVFHPRYLVIPKIGMLLTPFFLFLSAFLCIRKLKRQGYAFDLIDGHYLYPDGVVTHWLAKAFKVPYFLTARGSDVTQIGLMKIPAKQIVNACTCAEKVITVSNNLKKDLVKLGVPETHIETLRNGVDLAFFRAGNREAARTALGVKGSVLLFAGWLIPRKRVDLVLEVTKRLPLLTTVIVGSGPLQDELREMVDELGLSSRVIFLGQKRPDEMPALYNAADVLLLPSDREGWANVLLEAMACGTPVVSRDIGSAPDFITDPKVGLVVPSDKAEDLADAIESCLKNSRDRDYVRKFAENFGWQETSQRQYQLFASAVQSVKAHNAESNVEK